MLGWEVGHTVGSWTLLFTPSLNGGFLTITLPTGPEVFAGLGGWAYCWELEVTVHSTCLNARIGG